jgi:ankyrin repeat protein
MPDALFEQLYRAIKSGRLAEVEAFLAGGGDPNLSNRYGWSLLMAAAMKGKSSIVAVLLDAGADINAKNDFGESALALAAGGGYPKTLKILLSKGASVEISPHGYSLSGYMRFRGCHSPAIIKILEGVQS